MPNIDAPTIAAALHAAELERRATRLARESADLLAARRAIMGEVAA
jgi:hypothetical protein